jgi:hypothetical protein
MARIGVSPAVGFQSRVDVRLFEEAGIVRAALGDASAASFDALASIVREQHTSANDGVTTFVLAVPDFNGTGGAQSALTAHVVDTLSRPRKNGLFVGALAVGDNFDGDLLLAAACPLLVAEVGAMLAPDWTMEPALLEQVLAKRIGLRKAAALLENGGPWDAVSLYEIGVIDQIAELGTGEATTRESLLARKERGRAYMGFWGAREAYLPFQPATYPASSRNRLKISISESALP